MVWAAEQGAAVDPGPVACRLPAAEVVHQLQAAAVRLWFLEQSASAPGQE
jgi:hypothetical protein